MRVYSVVLALALAPMAGCKAGGDKPVTTPGASGSGAGGASRPADTLATSGGDVTITPIHHATLLLQFGGKAIYLDPAAEGAYDGLPQADYVFVTDIHPDHLHQPTIDRLKGPATVLVGPQAVADKVAGMVVLKNGESRSFGAFSVTGVPMYNMVRGPSAGQLFHDKGRGDGFVFTFGDKRVYASGDTECTQEMRALEKIDVAFVCMNLPYTMPPLEAAECVKAFRPKVVYPYHYKGQDLGGFQATVGGERDIEIRLRNWY